MQAHRKRFQVSRHILFRDGVWGEVGEIGVGDGEERGEGDVSFG